MRLPFECAFAMAMVVLVACEAACAAGRRAAAPPHASSKTMEQRIRDSVLNQPVKEDSILFPHPNVQRLDLTLVPTGQRPLDRTSVPDADRYVWRICPKTDSYLEYFNKRAAMLKAGGEKRLIDWCVQKRLHTAVEFELRHALRRISDLKDREYHKYRKRWLPYADRRQTAYTFALPVDGEWFVLRDSTGHHRIKHWATYAFDLVITKNGTYFRGRGRKLTDHYCWGKPVRAQADGVVMYVIDGNPDVPVGHSGGYGNANQLNVYYGAGIQGHYGHLQKGSIRVKKGDRVKQGDILGLVGNSGASGMPHLHFTMLDRGGFSLKGRFSYKRKAGSRWLDVNGKDLVENAYIKDWVPSTAVTKRDQPSE